MEYKEVKIKESIREENKKESKGSCGVKRAKEENQTHQEVEE